MADWHITGKTRMWVRVARPSAHVRAAHIFNQASRARGPDVVAVSIDAAPPETPALVRGLKEWRIA